MKHLGGLRRSKHLPTNNRCSNDKVIVSTTNVVKTNALVTKDEALKELGEVVRFDYELEFNAGI